MSSTQVTGVDPNRGTSEDAVKRQLDALTNGECDHIAFLDAMKERFRFEPDENWEVLSLLDQYYRRGKIPLDVFRTIKNGFAEYILGPQVAMPTLHNVAIPAPTPAASPSAKAMPTASAAVSSPVAAAPIAAASAASASPKPSAAPVREVRVGDVLRDRYRIEATLAKGDSGTVFEASDAYRLTLPPVGKRLALKMPRTPDPRGAFLSQLRHEFHQLQHLSHPNIVRAFDFDRDGALAFVTMELLNGVHLTQILQTKNARTLPRAYALAIIRDIGSAIAYAHSRGTVHGDVNPHNVFITMAGEVRLLGFGAAHKMSTDGPAPEFERDSAASDTHRYASCEVFEGNRPTVQDDIYSLSCFSYLLLKGRHPYADTTSIEARASHLRPRRPAGLTYQQWRMLRAGLRTDARKRPGSAQEWLDAMELTTAAQPLPSASSLIEARPDKPRRLQIVAATLLIAALIGVSCWFYWLSAQSNAAPQPPLTGQRAGEDQTAPASTPSTETAPPAAITLPRTVSASAQAPAPPSAAAAPPAAPRPAIIAATQPPPTATTATSTWTRIEMAADTLEAAPGDTAVHVTVRRKGSLRGVISFTWWTESGTAKPGTDFSPVLPHIVQMQDGESSAVLTVPLVSTLRAQAKGFYVGIESGEGGAQIGAHALTQVTLPPSN